MISPEAINKAVQVPIANITPSASTSEKLLFSVKIVFLVFIFFIFCFMSYDPTKITINLINNVNNL